MTVTYIIFHRALIMFHRMKLTRCNYFLKNCVLNLLGTLSN
uniref:Uncharacterized protein n=1 Tax=Anguilla anguilla TaxID=7936 RepID=A0A0E9UK12_ANGAN